MGFAASKCCSTDEIAPDSAAAAADVAIPAFDDGLALAVPESAAVFTSADDAPTLKEDRPEDDISSAVAMEVQKSFSTGRASIWADRFRKSLSQMLSDTCENSEEQDPEKVGDASLQVDEEISETPGGAPATAVQDINKSAPQESPSLESGTLTKKEVSMVEKSWMKVEALGFEAVGVILFRNIFSIEPACLQLFSFKFEPGLMNSTKLKQHVAKVVSTVGVAIANLRTLDVLVPVLKELALKHVGYGIVPLSNKKHYAYYGVIGHALLKTLRKGLGKKFTPQLEVAWAKVYTLLADTMITASLEVKSSLEDQLEGYGIA